MYEHRCITYVCICDQRGTMMYIYTLFFINFCHLFFYFKVVIGDADLQNASPMKCHWRRGLAKRVTYEGLLETRFGKTRHLWGVIGDTFLQNVSPMITNRWRGFPCHRCDSHRWRKFSDANFFRHQLDFFRVTNEEFWHSANKWCIFWKELWLIYQSWTEAEKTRRNFKGLHKCWISWPSTSP